MITEQRCSGLARVMACAGSLGFKNLPDEESSEPAKQGTAFGEYAQALMETGKPPLQPVASNGVNFDQEMDFYARPHVADMQANLAEGTHIVCEQRIDWKTESGIVIRGQPDAAYEDREGALCIDDFKYGWGIVEVTKNWQLLGYAIGEMIRRQKAYAVIKLRIRQPRPHHEDGDTRTWVLKYHDLLEYKAMIEARMMQIASGHNELQTSKLCKYCPAGGVCPALSKAAYNAIEMSQHFMQDDITNEVISVQLDQVSRAMELLKIRQDSLQALAVDRVKKGGIVPNYVLDASYSDRKWKSGISPETIEKLTGKKIVETSMMSPAKAEKAGVPKKFVNALVDRHFIKNNLVRKDISAQANKLFGKPEGAA